MPSNVRRSKAVAAATPRFSPLVENISRGISDLNLSGPQAPERHHLWFIPANLAFPPRKQNGQSHSKKKPINHVPRPRNAFFLFKSHFIHQGVLPTGIAFYGNHQQVCRIVAQIWKVLPDEERNRFYALRDEEERLHQARFPAYRITARNRRTKDWDRYLPIDESNMTPAEVTCKRIAEIVLQNIRGEELATQIRGVVGVTPHSGLFDPASLSALSRKKSTKDGYMNLDRIVPTSRVKPARKSNEGRANKPQSPRKPRSSSSKKKQSKAAMKLPRALTVNPSRLERFFSDNESSGDFTDPNTSYTSSKAGLPTAFVTSGGVSTDSSVDTGLDTPSRLLSPFTAGDAVGDSPSRGVDVSPFDTPFDQGMLFETYGCHWGSIDEYKSSDKWYNGLHDDYTTDQQPVYDGAQPGRCYEAAQVPIGDLFTENPVASPEPQTISPQCLL